MIPIGSTIDMADKKTLATPPSLGAEDIAKLFAQSANFSEILRTQIETMGTSRPDLPAAAASIPIMSTQIEEAIKASKIALRPSATDGPQETIGAVTVSLPKRLAKPGTDAIAKSERQPQLIASPTDLGILVKTARESQKLSQQSFADLAGVGRRFVSELENGKATLELGKVIKVTNAAGISLFASGR